MKSTDTVVLDISKNESKIKYNTDIDIFSNHNAFQLKLSCLVLKQITSFLPSVSFNGDSIQIPPNLRLADPDFNISSKIDILVVKKELLPFGEFFVLVKLILGLISLFFKKPNLAGSYLASVHLNHLKNHVLFKLIFVQKNIPWKDNFQGSGIWNNYSQHSALQNLLNKNF